LDPIYYEVDYDFGIITFAEGFITPSNDIDISYRYSPFGGADKALLTALGLSYEKGPFQVHNLTLYNTTIKGKKAPQIGEEKGRVIKNDTEFEINLGSADAENSIYASLKGGAAFSFSNNNIYGRSIIADMENESYIYNIENSDENWIISSRSSILTEILGNRGNILYKNYYSESIFSGDTLHSLSWDIPEDQIFNYSDKAGPYNTADKPSNGEDKSLVIDYSFSSGDSNTYASIVTPLSGENLSDFERFNIILESKNIAGSNVRLYVELLKDYNEDINNNERIDGESSINDAGFDIAPTDGEKTVIGSNRKGKSNGKIDSEDLNGNGYLDHTPEDGFVITQDGSTPYLIEFNTDNTDWKYLSFSIINAIKSNREIFQYANAVRITVVPVTSPLTSDATGKILINKLWFSGSNIVNCSTDFINISEVSVNEDPVVKENAFSKSYPNIYDELHGDSYYREKNEHVEGVLKFNFSTTTNPLNINERAYISRRFISPVDFCQYKKYIMYMYLPDPLSSPDYNFFLSFLSSEKEKLEIEINPSSFKKGWNSIPLQVKCLKLAL